MSRDLEVTTRGEARVVLIGMLVGLALGLFLVGWIFGWFRLSPLSPMEVEAAEAQEWIIQQGFPCDKPRYFFRNPLDPLGRSSAKVHLPNSYLFHCSIGDRVSAAYYAVRTAEPYPGKVEAITFDDHMDLIALEKLRRVLEKAKRLEAGR